MNSIRLSFATLLLLFASLFCSAQTTITNGDGSPLTVKYCFIDQDFEIIGFPAGGTFSGCGRPHNGKWYINPANIFGGIPPYGQIVCMLTYTPPIGAPVTKSLTFISLPCSSQTTITNGDGSPLKEEYCYSDEDFELIGLPAGGTFSGCGLSQKNGKWFINPIAATGGNIALPMICKITYTSLFGESTSKRILIHKPVVISPPLKDTFTCNGEIELKAMTLYAGNYEYKWTPEVYLINPNVDSTQGSITATQVFKIKAMDISSGCEGYDSILVDYKAINEDFDISIDKYTVHIADTFQLTIINPSPEYNYQWRDWKKGINIGNADTLKYAIPTSGKHRIDLIASNDKCSKAISTTVTVLDVTSINNPNGIPTQINIYPNPTTDEVNINSSVRVVAILSTMEGRKIMQVEDAKTLSLKNLAEGMYLLRIVDKNDKLLKTEIIVKQK